MATKTFYVTRDMKHPFYRTRMLKAGQSLELDGPTANLYKRLNVISDTPVAPAPVVEPKVSETPQPAAAVEENKAEKPAPKRPRRKRAAKK
jgi:hypothetical protein